MTVAFSLPWISSAPPSVPASFNEKEFFLTVTGRMGELGAITPSMATAPPAFVVDSLLMKEHLLTSVGPHREIKSAPPLLTASLSMKCESRTSTFWHSEMYTPPPPRLNVPEPETWFFVKVFFASWTFSNPDRNTAPPGPFDSWGDRMRMCLRSLH